MNKPSYKNYQNTGIRPESSQADITRELNRYGIYEVQHTNQKGKFSVAFKVELDEIPIPLMVRIDVPYNKEKDIEDRLGWKKQRVLYRTLFFYIKALLNTWDNGLKTFTEIFMPHLILPNGGTVEQVLLPQFTKAITEGRMKDVPLLAEPRIKKISKEESNEKKYIEEEIVQ